MHVAMMEDLIIVHRSFFMEIKPHKILLEFPQKRVIAIET